MNPPAPRSVLIVDDEPTIRVILRALLSNAGYVVAEAETGAGGLDAVRAATRPFDVVLLDLRLPDGGVRFIPELRALAPATRVLVVSGSHVDDAAELGADGFLGKPFAGAALLDAVRKLLGEPGA